MKARAEANGDHAVVVLDDQERPTAWPWLRQLKGETIHAGEEDLINLDHRATLNDALDTMLTSSHGGAVVTGDRDRYLGVVDFTAVTDHMQAQQERLEAAAASDVPAESNPQDEHVEEITADDGSRRWLTQADTDAAEADAAEPTEAVASRSAAQPDQRRVRDRAVRDPGHRGASASRAYAVWHATANLDSVEESALAWPTIWQQIWEHVKLTFVSAFFVIVIAVPLGILLTRGRAKAAAPLVVGFANAGQAAPSVGLIVLFAMWLGFGFWTAVIVLTVYAILPVLRNTIVGLAGRRPRPWSRPAAASACRRSAVLLRIELPLALPVIMAGVRTALVLLVGTATLATFINGGGLGATLQAGISLLRYPVIVWGAVLVALLALLIEWLGRVLELVARPKGV